MIPEFERMIFDLNEGLHHAGLIPDDRYITGSYLIVCMAVMAIIMIGYNKIVVWSDWYEEHEEFFNNTLPKISAVFVISSILFISFYFEAYAEILIFMIATNIILIIGTRKEFAGFRQWLDKNFGWLF